MIDDGSHDGTAERARAAGANVVNHDGNLGYGEAIGSCFALAKANGADVLVTLDGDGQHNPDELPQILAPILGGEADVVNGSRFLGGKTNMPRYRRFGIDVITLLDNIGSNVKVSDAQSGFRAYNRKAFQNFALSERGMSVSIEILEEAKKRGTIVKEVSISCRYVPTTLSVKAIRHGLGVAFSVFRIRFKSALHGLFKNSV